MNNVNKLVKSKIINIIKRSIEEDTAGYGDITSKYLIPLKHESSSNIVCKEKDGAILCGIDIIGYILEEVDKDIKLETRLKDGMEIKNKDVVCNISGPTLSILLAERTCLNFVQYLSGIATITSKFAHIAKIYGVKIADTRKTKPNLRILEKYAVACGGGYNHRFGLYDGILIKDNHIKAAGGVKKAIEKIRNKIPHGLKIEVEVKTSKQLNEAISCNADIIMLDNMGANQIKKSNKIIKNTLGNHCIVETSGNINLENVEDICKTGVDIISTGFITHSASSIDFSMKFI